MRTQSWHSSNERHEERKKDRIQKPSRGKKAKVEENKTKDQWTQEG